MRAFYDLSFTRKLISLLYGVSLCLAIAIGVVSTAGFAQENLPLQSSPNQFDHDIVSTAELSSPLTVVIETRGSDIVKIVSLNGRYIVQGPIMDTWTGQTITTTEGVSRARKLINLTQLDIDDKDIEPMYFGDGPKQVLLVVDPLEVFSQQLLTKLYADPAYAELYTFKILTVPYTSEDSSRAVTSLTCYPDSERALRALLESDTEWMISTHAVLEECDPQSIIQRQIMAQMIGANGVPFLVAPEGTISEGAPNDLYDFFARG